MLLMRHEQFKWKKHSLLQKCANLGKLRNELLLCALKMLRCKLDVQRFAPFRCQANLNAFIVVVHKHKSLQVKHMLHCHQICKGNISAAVYLNNMESLRERMCFKSPPQEVTRRQFQNCEEVSKLPIHLRFHEVTLIVKIYFKDPINSRIRKY